MANSDASAYLSVIQWGDKAYYLKEFTQNFTLPQAAKIIKGQYQNVGVPTLPCPSLNQIVLIVSAGKKVRVGAQCVKFKDNRGVVPLGPKLAIPDNYDGWFEILSEDGRAVRCLENVSELARVFPETCLVRETVKGFLSKSEDPDTISDKTRTIAAGETLVLINELLMPLHKGKGTGRFLRCFTTRGETVYLSLEQKGKFSPIAGEGNISGVHSIKNLLSKRLPLMVRLVHGKPPPGFKSSFIPEMRLCSLLEEGCVMVLPLLKDFNIVSLPINLPLKLQAPSNVESLIKLREYSRLSEKCKKMMQEASDRMQVVDPFLKKDRIEGKLNCRYFHNHRHPKHIRNIPLIKRSFSDPLCQETAKTLVNLEPDVSVPGENDEVENGVTNPSDNQQVPDDRYDEIDQIYDYVRGFAPLPSKVKTELKTKENPSVETPSTTTKCTDFTIHPSPAPQSLSQKDTDDVAEEKQKPEPPPIETIPARKLSLCAESTQTSAESTQTSAQKITVSIVNKSSSKLKDDTVVCKDIHPEEHIYEKVGHKSDERKSPNPLIHHQRAPIRSTSAGKVYIASGNHSTYNNKLFFKSPSQQKYIHKNRFLKHSKTSPSKDTAVPIQRTSRAKSYRNSKALTTSSPLFHIRYKSLTNLVAEFNNTLDSSNSGGQTSSGSAGSKEKDSKPRNRKLPRPKSMTNLFWDVHHLDSCNKYNLIQNEINNKIENRKFIFAHETSSAKFIHATQNKRIGTLYL